MMFTLLTGEFFIHMSVRFIHHAVQWCIISSKTLLNAYDIDALQSPETLRSL